MKKYYNNLNQALSEYNFDTSKSVIFNDKILAICNKNKNIYICTYVSAGGIFTIDNCKPYQNLEIAMSELNKYIKKNL